MYDRSEVVSLLHLTKQGVPGARDRLLEAAKPFVVTVVSRYSYRRLGWQDDEVSIGLIAFNEAIDAYKGTGENLFSFAQQVIRRRLVDYFRSQSRFSSEVAILDGAVEQVSEFSAPEVNEAWERYRLHEEAMERAEEIRTLEERLAFYGISMGDLVSASPVHRQTRIRLLNVASLLARDECLFKVLTSTGRLPKKGLCAVSGVSSRMLDRGRKYVIAIALILHEEDFPNVKRYLNIREGEGHGD